MDKKPPPTFVGQPTLETELREYPYVLIRFRCDYCRRRADVRSVACAAKYGHRVTMGYLLARFRRGCKWSDEQIRKPQKYGMKCTGYCYDLYRSLAPDLPPTDWRRLPVAVRPDMLKPEPREATPLRGDGGPDDVQSLHPDQGAAGDY